MQLADHLGKKSRSSRGRFPDIESAFVTNTDISSLLLSDLQLINVSRQFTESFLNSLR